MDSLKIQELKAIAKERGVANFSKLKRKELIESILSDLELNLKKSDEKENGDDSETENCKDGVCKIEVPDKKIKKPKKDLIDAETENCKDGVCKIEVPNKKIKKPKKDLIDAETENYLNNIISIPISLELENKLDKNTLQALYKKDNKVTKKALEKLSKSELFQSVLKTSIINLLQKN